VHVGHDEVDGRLVAVARGAHGGRQELHSRADCRRSARAGGSGRVLAFRRRSISGVTAAFRAFVLRTAVCGEEVGGAVLPYKYTE
jgi:hypothetical protein